MPEDIGTQVSISMNKLSDRGLWSNFMGQGVGGGWKVNTHPWMNWERKGFYKPPCQQPQIGTGVRFLSSSSEIPNFLKPTLISQFGPQTMWHLIWGEYISCSSLIVVSMNTHSLHPIYMNKLQNATPYQESHSYIISRYAPSYLCKIFHNLNPKAHLS